MSHEPSISSFQSLRQRFESLASDTSVNVPTRAHHISDAMPSNTILLRNKWEAFIKQNSDGDDGSPPRVSSLSRDDKNANVSTHARSMSTRSHVKPSRSGTNVTLTEADHNEGVLCKMRCRAYRLRRQPLEWIECGTGNLYFKTDRNTERVFIYMVDRKSSTAVMNQPVHPDIELEVNQSSSRSWIWTSTDYAHLENNRPTIQTFALKFKDEDGSANFKVQYDRYRDVNRQKDITYWPTKEVTPVDASGGGTSPVHTQGSTVATTPSAMTTSSTASTAVRASVTPNRKVNSNNKSITPSTLSKSRSDASLMHLAHRSKQTLDMKASKLEKFFGASLPPQVVEEQAIELYEPSTEVIASFPRRHKTAKYTTRSVDSILVNPVLPTADADTCASQIAVLKCVRELTKLDRHILQGMVSKLEKENALLRARVEGVSSENVESSASDATNSAITTQLAEINEFYQVQCVSIQGALENLKRGEQFKIPGRRKIVDVSAETSSFSHARPSLIRQLVSPEETRNFTAVRDPPREEKKLSVFEFRVMKVNRIRRNTPRVLKVDVNTSTLTICKTADETYSSTYDLHLSADSLLDASPSSANELLLTLSFYPPHNDSSSVPSLQAYPTAKNWKLVFVDRTERDRFFRLLQIHMIGDHANVNLTASGVERKSSTYVPMPLRFSQKVKFAVRSLPVQRLARDLHTVWCWERSEHGWRYGSIFDSEQLRHPFLQHFNSLPKVAKNHYVSLVTQTIASMLTIGFSVNKSSGDEDHEGVSDTLCVGMVDRDIVQLVGFLAQNNHDTWAEAKMSDGWTVGEGDDPSTTDYDRRTDPFLKPFSNLPEFAKDFERNSAYKIIGSLVEWGYDIQKTDVRRENERL